MKKKEKFEDDGRTIANMNVEGTPWYTGRSEYNKPRTPKKNVTSNVKLTFSEKMAMTRGVLAAALLVALVFVGVFTLFILFCIYVWFK